MQRSFKLLCFVFHFLIYGSILFACTCIDYDRPACAEFSDSDAVFVGRVEKITKFEKSGKGASFPKVGSISTFGDSGLIYIRVKIEKAFKGIEGKSATVAAYKNTSCDIGPFKKGQRWIFFALRNKESGILGVGACSRTSQLKEKDDYYKNYFSELEKMGNGSFPMSIMGNVVKNLFLAEKQNAFISIEGENFLSSTNTKDGYFSFQVPKPGKYKVSVKVPFSAGFLFINQYRPEGIDWPGEIESVFQYEVEAEAGKCAYDQVTVYRINPRATAKISGNFLLKDWKYFPKFYPSICKYMETEEETLKTCESTYSLKPDGSFQFSELKEGEYVIVANEKNLPDVTRPFSRHYYPGVRNFEDAAPIFIRESDRLEGLKFHLPEQLTIRKIKGQVFYRNRKPAVNADESGKSLYLSLYEYQKPFGALNERPLTTDWGSKNEKETMPIKVNPDGSFEMSILSGFSYWVRAQIETRKGKVTCGFKELKSNLETNEKLGIILDQGENCRLEDYLNSPKRK